MSKTRRNERSESRIGSRAIKRSLIEMQVTVESFELAFIRSDDEPVMNDDGTVFDPWDFTRPHDEAQAAANWLQVPVVFIDSAAQYVFVPTPESTLLDQMLTDSIMEAMKYMCSASATSDIGQLDLEIGQLSVPLFQGAVNYRALQHLIPNANSLKYRVMWTEGSTGSGEDEVIGLIPMLRSFWNQLSRLSAADKGHNYRTFIGDGFPDEAVMNMAVGFTQELNEDEMEEIARSGAWEMTSDDWLPRGVYVQIMCNDVDDAIYQQVERCVIESAKSYAGINIDQAGYWMDADQISENADRFHADDVSGQLDPDYIAYTISPQGQEDLRGMNVFGVHPTQEQYYITL